MTGSSAHDLTRITVLDRLRCLTPEGNYMETLVKRFEATGTLKDAKKLIYYIERHPMCMCFADTYAYTWIEVAKEMVERATFED